MSAWLIAFVGFIYLLVAADLIIKDQVFMGIMYLGYALANVGAWKLAKMVA